jgi:hypothetical protein
VPSQSLLAAQANLGVVNDILSFHSKEKNPAPGAPMTADASLVLGATALLYAVWEAYTEDLAIELVDGTHSGGHGPAGISDGAGRPWSAWVMAAKT